MAILKFFKWHLPNYKSDWTKTWWEASKQHRFTVAKIIPCPYPRWPPWQPSWNSSNDISQTISQIEPKLDWRHQSDIEIHNCYNRAVQISKKAKHCGYLENPRYPRWLPWRKSWKSSNNISPKPKSDWAETWWEASEQHRDSKFLKSFCSYIQDGHHRLFVLGFYSPVNPMGLCRARSVLSNHIFTGQAKSSKWLTSIVHILLPETDNCPSWISGRERMTSENISWSNLHERILLKRRESNLQPPDHQSDVHPTEPPRPEWPP